MGSRRRLSRFQNEQALLASNNASCKTAGFQAGLNMHYASLPRSNLLKAIIVGFRHLKSSHDVAKPPALQSCKARFLGANALGREVTRKTLFAKH
jgi:hypothetical protein